MISSGECDKYIDNKPIKKHRSTHYLRPAFTLTYVNLKWFCELKIINSESLYVALEKKAWSLF
jgi:hypothetical protein